MTIKLNTHLRSAKANPNPSANPPKPLPKAQNNLSLGGIVSGRAGLDATNMRLGRVPNPDDPEDSVCDSDSPDYDPDAEDDCEEERQPRLKIS